jgi:hypothetical protein
MASIRAFIRPSAGAFDDHATGVMSEAFDAARKKVEGAGQIVREAIAAGIIVAAPRGERDPVLLRDAGLAGLIHDHD